ncbi:MULTISPECIES: type II toxin-antitoxin system HicA family toxin [Acetobacterium]|uniref:type II toxin-antitoxin system HicA family toxin n=1 Tax=Acetobacterium TaxID=33951 RepID=UPI001A9B3B55|nr:MULTISPECIES: type II toxin-antitoxin system HicA family toxin [Acetobacterium]
MLSENYNKTTAPRDILKLLEKNGWVEERIKGSHHVMKKNGKTEIIPVHGKDVPTGLLKTILKRTGLK